MHITRRMSGSAAPSIGAMLALAACGGAEVVAVVAFLGSAGGDWSFDDPAQPGFQPLEACGAFQNESCVVNIRVDGTRDLYGTGFNVSYTGNLPGCPRTSTDGGRIEGERITLPGCFSGRYVTINEAVSDDGRRRAYFDSEVPDLGTGVWVEIQDGMRRFKFGDLAAQRCELTTPRTPASIAIDPASLDLANPVLTTTITLTVGSETWVGEFVGVSGMRLKRGAQTMELQRRDLATTC